MRRLAALLTALFALALAPAAQADWFAAEPIDGPGEIESLGGVDVARDGGGGLVYVKREGGVPQVFLSRLLRGGWTAPERLSGGAPVSEAAIVATEGGRLAVAWTAGGEVLGTVVSGRRAPAPPAVLGGGGATGLDVDMGVNEAAYAVWAAGGDVRAARLEGTAWTALAEPLDIDPARAAGAGAGRPRVAVSAEGNAVAVWGEEGAGGRPRVFARRLTGLRLSTFPQDLTLDTFEGQPGGAADSPEIDVEDDGSFAWVVYRQEAGGRSRSVARRLRGSLFEDPMAIDGGATSSEPRIDMTGKGIGSTVAVASDNAIFSAYLNKFDMFDPAFRIDQTPGGPAPSPVAATSDRGDLYAAWRTAAGEVRVRRNEPEGSFAPEVLASNPQLGAVPAGQLAIGTDRSGNTAIAMIQGDPGARHLTVAVYDRLPGRAVVRSSSKPRNRRALIKWEAGVERWGRLDYTVYLDGEKVGTTRRTRLRSPRKLRPGRHRFQVRATDRRGQVSESRVRTFRVKRPSGRKRSR